MENYVVTVYVLILVIFLIFWIWALLDLASSPFKKTGWKIAWLLIIISFPLLGSILYLLLRKEFKAHRRSNFDPQFRTNKRLQ